MTRELRMSYRVPDFEMDNDSNLPTFSRPKKTSLPEDELVELLWQNGQVVMQSQNQRSVCKSPPQDQSAATEIRPSILEDDHSALFMQEDEMASWLNYDPSLDHNFCADVLFNTSVISPAVMAAEAAPVELRSSVTVAMGRPPIPPGGRRIETSNSKAGLRESTVVDSSDTPSVGPDSRVSEMAVRKTAAGLDGDVQCEIISRGGGGGGEVAGGVTVGGDGVAEKENMICEMTVPSSPDGSIASAEPAAPKPVADDRKRKGRALDDNECQSEDIEYESVDAKKQLRGSTSTKRSRAAEVHNLSERRRRDRINEKMKALQELIPRCNKTDKASMLDEAIEYLKALQLQVQMMSMGCGMVPMMFSGVQQYMPPPMGMGIGMGMGMGMEMGMNRPMMQFPSLLAGSTLPMQAGAGHLGPRFPLPNFAMHPGPVSDPSRTQTSNQAEQMLNSISTLNTSHPTVSGLLDSYQQFLSSNHMHFSITQASPQNQPLVQSNTSRPCTSKGPENLENHQPG